jgi:hypothetical protein
MNLSRNGVWVFLAVFAAICFCCCGGLGFLGYRTVASATKIKDEALAYGDDSVKAMCKSWDPAELEKRLSANLKRRTTHAQVMSAMSQPLKRYGPLKRLISSSVQHIGSFSALGGSQATTVMSWTECEFAKGPGKIQLNLRKENGEWTIDAFHISPDTQ